jgi:hypothetical protein
VKQTLKKSSKPLGLSKTVATSYLAPEAPSGRRTRLAVALSRPPLRQPAAHAC